MCGIAGVLAYRSSGRTDEREITTLRDAQTHRGPDDAGLWVSEDGRVGLGHRRLSIIDLSPLGRQPMATADGRYQIVFNGEIYNFLELRGELEERGCQFVSSSDTEVLLHGYREWGMELLDRLRGMFAFALHDRAARETVLARDPLGIKPLYVLDDGARILFASEVQALRVTADAGGLDPEGLASYLQWGSIPPPLTIYRNVRALPAGSWARVREGGLEAPRVYFAAEEMLGRSESMDAEEARGLLRDALCDSARSHLVADVPVGAFLSGGVDSSALVGLLSEAHNAPLCTVTLSFDDPAIDESSLSRQASQVYGSDHHEIPIRIEEMRDRIPDAIRALDQPSVDGINTYFVSEAAVRAGLKVAVSGVGGDELFGGYLTFARVPRLRGIHRRLSGIPLLGSLLSPAAGVLDALPDTRLGSKLALALRYGGSEAGAYFADRGVFSPSEVRSLLAPELADAVASRDPIADLEGRIRLSDLPEDERVSALELRHYLQVQLLRDTDAVSMRHSLEVRTPLVDRELLRAAARVPPALRRAGPAKKQLREAPRPPVPDALWNRRKQGFNLPFDDWLKPGGFPIELPEHPWLRGDAMRRLPEDYRRGRLHHSRLWVFLVLREFLD